MPVRNLSTLLLVTIVCLACALQARHMQYGAKVGLAIGLIEDNYIDPIEPTELYTAAMQGMVSKLDQFSEFIPPQRYQEFNSVIEQKFGGIGIQIEGPPNVPRLTVITPLPKTPAFKAGIQAGDTIWEINGRSTDGLTAIDATKIMRGPIGTSVELLIQRMDSSDRVTLTIPRADIEVDSVYGDRIRTDSTWDYFLEEDPRIAYIRVALFGERTRSEFAAALKAISDRAEALVIDLRFNPGGVLPAAVELCDMLVDHGVIVRTRGRRAAFDASFEARPQVQLATSLPLVVLVNEESASASEIMAGCLQDLGRARIAGSRSYGKGTVQQVFSIENGRTALKFTTARFLRPSFKNIHRTDQMSETDDWGVTPEPDLTLKLDEVQQIYLNRRWLYRGDPRIMGNGDRAPEPSFAADPQLKLVVDYLQQQLAGSVPSAESAARAAEPTSATGRAAAGLTSTATDVPVELDQVPLETAP